LNKETKITHGFTPLQIDVMVWDCDGGSPPCPSGRKLYILSKSTSQTNTFKATLNDLRSISLNAYDVQSVNFTFGGSATWTYLDFRNQNLDVMWALF
jgi:hypothetical protein